MTTTNSTELLQELDHLTTRPATFAQSDKNKFTQASAEEESRKKFLAYKQEVSRMAEKVQHLQAGINAQKNDG
jgi:hypothetical protein